MANPLAATLATIDAIPEALATIQEAYTKKIADFIEHCSFWKSFEENLWTHAKIALEKQAVCLEFETSEDQDQKEIEELKLLRIIDSNRDLLLTTFDYQKLFLKSCVDSSKIDLVKLLLKLPIVDPGANESECITSAPYDILKVLLKDGRADPRRYKLRNKYNRSDKILLEDGRMDPFSDNGWGFYTAISNEMQTLVETLLQDPRMDHLHLEARKQIFLHAIRSNQQEILKLLLKDARFNPATFNSNHYQSDPIFIACRSSSPSIIELLFMDGRAYPPPDHTYNITYLIKCINEHYRPYIGGTYLIPNGERQLIDSKIAVLKKYAEVYGEAIDDA